MLWAWDDFDPLVLVVGRSFRITTAPAQGFGPGPSVVLADATFARL